METFYLRTYGCQMNELDSEVMAGILHLRGLRQVDEEEDADLLIYNTCAVRDLSEQKIKGKLNQLKKGCKKERIIGIAGCVANADKEKLFEFFPHLDFVIGTNNIHELNEILDNVIEKKQKEIRTDRHFFQEVDYSVAKRQSPVSAYVSIIRGCSKHCTYCTVPYTRGKEISRTPSLILEECKQLADKGYKEITLLGQNVNSYEVEGIDGKKMLFHDLLYEIDKISGIERLRFITCHPIHVTDLLVEAVRDLSSVCEYIHFPLQSGSNRILKKMHRMYSFEEYMEKIQAFLEKVPNISFGTDIIVGFPTETEEDFQMTVNALTQISFSQGFFFAYSPRPKAPSYRWKDDVPNEVKKERLHTLLALQNTIYAKQRKDMIGQEVEILVERENAKEKDSLCGKTRCLKRVIFNGDKSLIGTLQKVKIVDFSHQTLLGTKL